MLILVLFAIAAVFALALAVRLGVHAKGLGALRLGWKAWAALAVGVGLTLMGRPLGGFVFVSLGLVLAWPPASDAIPAAPQDLARARALLGVGAEADAAAIRAAYRAKMAKAHPDAGGSQEAAAALGRAKDLLLKALQ